MMPNSFFSHESDADNRELRLALAALEATAVNFASTCIREAGVRAQYMRDIKAAVDEIRLAANSGKMTPRAAATVANTLRNDIMDLARLRSSAIGRAYATKLKGSGKTLEALSEYYATKLFKKSFALLSEAEQSAVYMELANAAGRSNPTESARARMVGRVGKRLFMVSLAIAVYEIYDAEDKPRELARQGTISVAGVAGGMAAGGSAVAIGACAATAPVCIGVIALVGGLLFSFGAEYAFGTIYPRPAGH